MAETVFQELKRYVHFGPEDERLLQAFHPAAAPHFTAVSETFYQRILDHAEASKVLREGERSVGHLKTTLVGWMGTLLLGPWDEAYCQQRMRIGRVHVRIGMPQHYMFGAMNVVRAELDRVAVERLPAGAPVEATRLAIGKVLDLELAVMLHTYRDDLLAQQARVERLSTFGQLVGSIGHDLRNPLGVIETSLFILRGRVGEDERARKHTDRIKEQLDLANGIITNLLDMIRDRPLVAEPVALAGVVGGAVDALRVPPGVTILREGLDQLPPASGDAIQLRQVLVNLLENALFAVAAGGTIWVRGRAEGGLLRLSVEDTGPGVDPATRRRLFEPLITTKAHGNGLGLALCKRIAERHGGTLAYAERDGGGASFTLALPLP
jgi:signal transduction histidine kinase